MQHKLFHNTHDEINNSNQLFLSFQKEWPSMAWYRI